MVILLRATMAIAIIQTAPKGITCKITAIITAIKNSRKCQELSYKLTGVGTSQNTVAIKYTAPTRDFSFYPLFIL
ncbi:hypothetical protein WBT93_001401 [Campylobacter jejuni]|nr:hypothetical protein [Campylobacter jejuni]EJG9106535.1 hypothetical protein [Campylobacter jejuni]EMB1310576.1 hypothetical protein [Campylobacter jejuni]HAN0533891.1 hypothetical protein [Campylobacter jejuni]HED8394521.1 hypothetical protein [Campylobacter jejuni]